MIVHPLQSFQWGEFRKKTGVKVVALGGLQLTIHKIPYLPWTIGYLPKGALPTKKMITDLQKIGKQENCIFIQLEPNIVNDKGLRINDKLRPSFRPLFTKYTFQLDLTKSEEELLKNMSSKTRYNIRVAQKHGVKVIEDNSNEAFNAYLTLLKETTARQKFYAHTKQYHLLMWQTLKPAGIAHLLIASCSSKTSNLKPITLAAWILFVYDGVLYYPYGASSNKYKEVMASNLIMWETIRFGKKMGCKVFDMWGSLGPNPDKNDPWYGFHRFKQGYGGKLVEFAGSYDLVINPFLYELYKIADKLRWMLLKIKKL